MATGRGDTYTTSTDADSIEELSKKLTADLRKNIRALVRSGAWLRQLAGNVPVVGGFALPHRCGSALRCGTGTQ